MEEELKRSAIICNSDNHYAKRNSDCTFNVKKKKNRNSHLKSAHADISTATFHTPSKPQFPDFLDQAKQPSSGVGGLAVNTTASLSTDKKST